MSLTAPKAPHNANARQPRRGRVRAAQQEAPATSTPHNRKRGVIAGVAAVALVGGGAGVGVALAGKHGHPGSKDANPAPKSPAATANTVPGTPQNTASTVPEVRTSSPAATDIYTSPNILVKYPANTLSVTMDAGMAAFSALQNLRRYEVSGQDAYLDATIPVGVHDASRVQTGSYRNLWLQERDSLPQNERDAATAKEFLNLSLRAQPTVLSAENDVFDVHVTVDEYDAKNVSANGTGMSLDTWDVTLGVTTQETSGEAAYFVKNAQKLSGTLDH